jgi:hypothetical protein
VRNLYRAYLRRDADPAGLAAHVGWLRSGRTIAEVKANILGSAEYFFNPVWGGGGTNSGFMTALFRDVLGRGISGPDRTFWTQVLAQGAARYSVSLAVLRSRESLEGIGANYVQRLLRRPASAEEIAALSAALQSGSREEEIIATIVSSAEYVGSV